MDLFDLSATLTLDTSKYQSGLSGAASMAKSMGSKIGSALKTATLVTGALVAAGTAVTGVFVGMAKQTADYGDKVDKMSQKIGISAEAYQKWDYVMQRAGGSIDSMKMGMKTLSQQAEKNSDAFQKLGISQEEVQSLSQEDLFERTVKGLAGMEKGTERAALASQLLGRAGADMGPLLNGGTKAIEEQMEIAEKYGMVMPDAAVAASAAFEDSLTTMQMTMQGLKNRMMAEFLPAMTQVTDGMGKLFAGDDSGAEDVAKGIEGIVKKVGEVLPKVLKIGADIAINLGKGFIQNLQKSFDGGSVAEVFGQAIDYLVTNVPTWVGNFAQAFADNAPMIAEQGAEMILKLGEGLVKATPQLISAAGTIVNGLLRVFVGIPALLLAKGASAVGGFVLGLLKKANTVATAGSKLVSNAVKGVRKLPSQFLSWALRGVTSLASGFSKGASKVLGAAKSLASGAINAIKSGFGNVVSIGTNIVQGIGRGITNGTTWIKNQIKSFVGNVKSFLKNLFGIKSPSKWARDNIGKMIDAGLAKGITDNAGMVDDAMESVVPDIDSGAFSTTRTLAGTGNGVKMSYPTINTYVNVDGAENPESWADRLVAEFEMKARMA